MSVKTLNSVESMALPKAAPRERTYSIAPSPAFISEAKTSDATSSPAAAELDSFLAAENPLGCIRGVMWVMAFNAAVFFIGFMVWQSCKLLF